MSQSSSVIDAPVRDSRADRGFFGHPSGLANLFFVELWERFSYYGMRAILLYYLIDTVANGGLGIDKEIGEATLSIYGAAVYLLSIIGGYAADRLVGARRSVLYGGLVIMAGHVSLAVPGAAFSWLGIVLVALGTGLLKPNISAIVGDLYDEDDPRRDGGFQIFYMAVNIGSLIAPLVVLALRSRFGYHAGFSAAAVGMALAVVLFVMGHRRLRGSGDEVPNPLAPRERGRLGLFVLAALAGLAVAVFVARLWNEGWVGAVVDAISLVAIVTPIVYFTIMFRSPKVEDHERRHLRAYLPLWIGAALFFMLFEQASGKMASFAKFNTDLMGGALQPEIFQSINPAAVVILTPLFVWLWTRRAGRFPSTPFKFALAVAIIGVSALMLSASFALWPADGPTKAPFYILGGIFVVQTIAELCISPVGLAATTVLSPRAFASQALAVWYLASAAGQALGAQTIKLMEDLPDSTYYLVVGVLTLVAAAVLFALVPWTRRNMQDIEDRKRAARDSDVAGRAHAH